MCHFDNYSSTLATVPGAYEWTVPIIYCVIQANPRTWCLNTGVRKLWSMGRSGMPALCVNKKLGVPNRTNLLLMASGCLLVGMNICNQYLTSFMRSLKYLLPGLHTKRCQYLDKHNTRGRLYSWLVQE